MFNYNEDSNVLEIFKVPYRDLGTVYKEDDNYTSYKRYLDKTLKEDIEKSLMPEINKLLSNNATDDFPLYLESYRVVEEEAYYKGNKYYSVMVSIGGIGLAGATKEFCLMRMPYMDPYGVIERYGKYYALIRELVQDDDITYNKGVLKIITALSCFINLKDSSAEPKMVFRKKNISSIDVLAALTKKEGLDGVAILNKLSSTKLSNIFSSDAEIGSRITFANRPEVVDYLTALESDTYSLHKVRGRLNKVLSLDRAIGKELQYEVVLKDGTVLEPGHVLTKRDISDLKYDHINEVRVLNVPNMKGYYTAETLRLPILRRGTEIIDEIREYIGAEERGTHLSRDYYYIGNEIVIPENTLVREGFLDMLAYNGVMGLALKPDVHSNVRVYVPFDVNIIGNRHFKSDEIGLDKDVYGEWVYIDENDNIHPAKTHLCAYDLLAMISLYDRLSVGEDLNYVANMDLGLRKKVNLANESFHKAFTHVTRSFVNSIKDKIKKAYNGETDTFGSAPQLEQLFNKLAGDVWRELQKEMRLLSMIDKSNPIAYYSTFSKVKSIVKDKNAITYEQHSLSMGHYGRLCPYETPSGKQMGMVSNKAICCKIVDGQMKTPYYVVKHDRGKSYIQFNKIEYYTVEEEESFKIADIKDVEYNKKTGEILSTGRVMARVPNREALEKVTVRYIDIKYVDRISVDPNQSDSLAATTVPFQGANDAARVTFGLSMCKQAKGLLNPEVPYVLTSAFYDAPRVSPYFMVQAEYDGIVDEVSASAVSVKYDGIDTPVTYDFRTTEFSLDSLIIREVKVQEGDRVKAGDVLISSNFVKDGVMATGANCLVAYIPRGSNYEDGIYGSERLAQRLTSYGTKEEEELFSKKFKNRNLEAYNKFKYNSPGKVLYAVRYSVNSESKVKNVYANKVKGFTVNVERVVDPYNNNDKGFKVQALSINTLKQGDKLANRHGNKGVVPEIVPNSQMPQLMNGEIVDLCYNPAGVSSRMNIGQILECHLGLAAYVLKIRTRSDSFNGASTQEVKTLLRYAWYLANSENCEAVFKMPEFSELPRGLHEHCRKEINYIRTWKDSFNIDGTAKLYNPRTGKYFETPVLIGINYVYKLVHEVDKKIQARGGYCTEPYVEKFSSPTHGQSKHGGGRWGYMELDAIASHGAAALMHEALNDRSDNPILRNNRTVSALHKGDAYMLDEKYAIRRSTEEFINKLEVLGLEVDFEGELPNNTRYECSQRGFYKRNALLSATDVGSTNKTSLFNVDEEASRIDEL